MSSAVTGIPGALAGFVVEDDFARYGLSPGQAVPSPRYLQVELTDLCNLSCAGCVRATHDSVGSHLGLADFKSLLGQLPDLDHVSFVGAGEALIVRDFAEYVLACTRRGVFTSCNTNGILARRLPPVLDAGLGLLAVSVDGADDETLGTMRSGLRTARLAAAIGTAVALTADRPTRLSAAVTLSSVNVHTFRDIVAFVADLGVTEMSVESLHHWGADTTLNAQSLFAADPDEVRAHLEDGLFEAAARGLAVRVFDYRRLHHPPRAAVCPWPWDACYVTRDGDVTPCCVNLTAEPHNLLGNVLTTPIEQIWTGRRYAELRSSFLGGPEWPSCTGCVYRKEFGRANG